MKNKTYSKNAARGVRYDKLKPQARARHIKENGTLVTLSKSMVALSQRQCLMCGGHRWVVGQDVYKLGRFGQRQAHAKCVDDKIVSKVKTRTGEHTAVVELHATERGDLHELATVTVRDEIAAINTRLDIMGGVLLSIQDTLQAANEEKIMNSLKAHNIMADLSAALKTLRTGLNMDITELQTNISSLRVDVLQALENRWWFNAPDDSHDAPETIPTALHDAVYDKAQGAAVTRFKNWLLGKR